MSKKAKRTGKVAAGVSDEDRELFYRLVGEGASRDEAWRLVRKAFPREQWGKVRDIAAALTEFKTFTAAYKSVHGEDAPLSPATKKRTKAAKSATTGKAKSKSKKAAKKSAKGGGR